MANEPERPVLVDRYPGVPGCRLDTKEDRGTTGPAVDLGKNGTRRYSLWVRGSGTGYGKSVEVELTIENVRALRDGCSRLLVEAGVEREITIAVPR